MRSQTLRPSTPTEVATSVVAQEATPRVAAPRVLRGVSGQVAGSRDLCEEARSLESSELARLIVDIVSDKKGADILLLDTRPVSFIADYFVIVSGGSERQLKAIADEVQKQLKTHSVLPLGVEGTPASGWVLLDYGGVITHLFSPAMRDYYRLEQLWARAPVVVRMQ